MTISNLFNHARAFVMGGICFFVIYALIGILASPSQSWDYFVSELERNYSVESPVEENIVTLEASVGTASTVRYQAYRDPSADMINGQSDTACYAVTYNQDNVLIGYEMVNMDNCVLPQGQ